MKCPNCGVYFLGEDEICPQCHAPIPSKINPIYHFLKDNSQFLAVIGLLGTMLAFMPIFFEKISNGVWIGSLGLYGFILLTSTGLATIILMLLIILLLFEVCFQPNRLALIGILLIFFVFFFGIEYSITALIQNYYIGNFIINLVIFIFLIPVILFITIECRNPGPRNLEGKYPLKNKVNVIILVSLVLIGCTLFWIFIGYFYAQSEQNHQVYSMNNLNLNANISSDSSYYNPYLISSIGLDLYPSNITEINSMNLKLYKFHWQTNYGYFIYWIPNENRIGYLSNDTIQTGDKSREKIFWTYDINTPDLTTNKFFINLTVDSPTNSQFVSQELEMKGNGVVSFL